MTLLQGPIRAWSLLPCPHPGLFVPSLILLPRRLPSGGLPLPYGLHLRLRPGVVLPLIVLDLGLLPLIYAQVEPPDDPLATCLIPVGVVAFGMVRLLDDCLELAHHLVPLLWRALDGDWELEFDHLLICRSSHGVLLRDPAGSRDV